VNYREYKRLFPTFVKNYLKGSTMRWGLKEAETQGKLKGELKQIASALHEDDNPVILLAKYKE